MYASTHEAIAHCKAEGRCIDCGEKFSEENVFTEAGWRETKISGICEVCWERLFKDEEDEEE